MNFSLEKSNSDEKENEENNDHAYERRYKETEILKLRLFVYHSELEDYLYVIRGISFLSTKQHKCRQICE